MQLKKSVKNKLKESNNSEYIDQINFIFGFFQENYIPKLTPHTKPHNYVGQNSIILLQTNLGRAKYLSKGYMEGLNTNNPILSLLSLRALFETTGSLALLHKKYNQYLKGTLEQEKFEETLKRLYLGVKDKQGLPEAPDPINVMTLLDAVDYFMKSKYGIKDGKFRSSYDDLSEKCHPNSFGYFYGHKIKVKENFEVNFSNDNTIHDIKEYALEYISICTITYEELYKDLRRQIEENEELPFKELHYFKNYKWESGPNKSPWIKE